MVVPELLAYELPNIAEGSPEQIFNVDEKTERSSHHNQTRHTARHTHSDSVHTGPARQ
jgi:hypothetical protein